MAGQVFYAVHRGRNTGIYYSWEECRQQTSGFKQACFKKFHTLYEAEHFKEHGVAAPHNDAQKKVAYIKTTASAETSDSGAKAAYGIVWVGGRNEYCAKTTSGQKKTPNRAAIEAIADAIEKDIDGEDELTIRSFSQYAVQGYNSWSTRWINNGWKLYDGTPVKNKDAFERGLSLIDRRPGNVKIEWIRKQKTDELDLAQSLAQLALDEEKEE